MANISCVPFHFETRFTDSGIIFPIKGEAKIILKMNHSGMSPENIASITGKDLDEINAILEGKVPALL